MPARILLTGGTGFLGSHLAARLLLEGNELTLLARATAGASAAERVGRVMSWHGVGEQARRRLRVVEADLTAEALGLEPAEAQRLREETDEIVHCASETTFAERKRDLVERVNLGGLARLLEFATRAPRLASFHHVSTAYAVGRREGVCREDWADPTAQFHNAYEETKCRGEHLVREACAPRGIRAVVYRPSIVYGDSRSGRSLLFNALYHPVKAMVLLRDGYLEDLRTTGGEKARAAGVSLTSEGLLQMPLRIESEGAGIDLVPVDFFTDAFAAIHAAQASEGVFHVVAGRQTSSNDILAFASRMFGMSGIRAIPKAEMAPGPRNPLELAFDRMVAVYRPYMSDRRCFDTGRAGPLLAAAGLSCPALTFEVFERCMAYALEVDWGSRVP